MHVILGLLLALGAQVPTPATQIRPSHDAPRRQQTPGRISVWADQEQPYGPGDEVSAYFRTEQSGHVTILRVDTDGQIRVLFPREPWTRTYVRGGRTMEIADGAAAASFLIDDRPGIGYLFAVTSPLPFHYDDITRGDYWDFRLVENGRIRRDPYVALTDLARRITPGANFRYDIAPYYVERRYDYPRFVCYECHSPASSSDWDPYSKSCLQYRVVIYDDPAYYPYRYNRGQNVVPTRPLRPAPRYVFRDAAPGVKYVTRLRQQESHARRRSAGDRGRTSADVGGRAIAPTPVPGPEEPSAARRVHEQGPVLRRNLADPKEDVRDEKGRPERRRGRTSEGSPPEGLRPADREPAKVPPVQRGARTPQSTGEPALRRRKP
jgi:hypothetical protein